MDAHTCRHTHICADFPSTYRSTPAHRSPHTNVHTHKDAHTGMCTQILSSTPRHVHRQTHTHRRAPQSTHTTSCTQTCTLWQAHTQRHRCRPLTYSPTQKHDHGAPRGDPSQPHRHTHAEMHTQGPTGYHTHTDSSLQRHTHTRAGPHRSSPSRHAHTYLFLLGLPHSSSRQRGPGVLPTVLQRIHSQKGTHGLVPDLGRLSQQCHCVSLPLLLPSAPVLTPGAECGRRWTPELPEGPLRRGEDRPGPSSLVALVLLLRAAPTPHSVNPQRTSGCEV